MSDTRTGTSLSTRITVASVGVAVIVVLIVAALATEDTGAQEYPVLDNGRHLLDEAHIMPLQAVEIALSGSSGSVDDVDLERIGKELIYEIEIDGADLYVDALNGRRLHVEFDNDEDIVSRPINDSR